MQVGRVLCNRMDSEGIGNQMASGYVGGRLGLGAGGHAVVRSAGAKFAVAAHVPKRGAHALKSSRLACQRPKPCVTQENPFTVSHHQKQNTVLTTAIPRQPTKPQQRTKNCAMTVQRMNTKVCYA